MGTHYTATEKQCSLCGFQIIRVDIKSPYIDDYEYECSNHNCKDYGDGISRLKSRERSEAERDIDDSDRRKIGFMYGL